MDWVLDHLQIIIAIAGSIAWWLNKNRKGGGEESSPQPEASFDDPELAERTRKIREEIQRKIAERARGYANEQPTRPHDGPAEPPVVREAAVSPTPPGPRASTAHYEAQRQAEILEQQAALAEKLQEAQVMKAAAIKRAQYEATTADQTAEVQTQTRLMVLGDLRDPATLRRAFILREVLGPPMALR